MRDFCRTMSSTVEHRRAKIATGSATRVQQNQMFASAENPTNQGVVGSIPAGRAKYNHLEPAPLALFLSAGPLRDLLSTAAQSISITRKTVRVPGLLSTRLVRRTVEVIYTPRR